VETVATGLYPSEVMHGYQKRIKKSESKLFTFLEHDDVPWTNNNAEHAIKYFANYRDLADGTVSERSLKEALALLSVFQTCHFNGVNVIKFLLSGKSDLASIMGLQYRFQSCTGRDSLPTLPACVLKGKIFRRDPPSADFPKELLWLRSMRAARA
jgi:hypothetical protein